MLPSEAYSQNNEDLVIKVLRELITGKGIDIETFGKQPTSAEAEALRLLNYNTGKFAQNYVEEQKNLDPRIVKAMGVQKEKKEETDMPQMQEGGMLGDLPPEAIANGNVIQGAPVGEVAVPGGGGPTDDGVPTSLPEGTFVLNAASVEYHGTKHINDLIKKSVRNLVKKGVQISGEDLNPDDDVPVAISNGEYIIPPEVARDIGIKKLEDMNERGLEYRKRIEEQEKQKRASQEQAMQSFMGAPIQSEQQMPMQEGGEASPPDEAMPKPPEDTSGLTEGQKAVIEAEMLKRRLQQEFFNRESERQRRMMEQEERDKGMIFNERTGEFDLMAQADKPVVPATPAGPNIMTGPRKQDYMDKLIQQSMKARGMAQVGGAIERDPQSTFLVPQIVRQAQGLPQGANTFPTSPQESFIGGIPTGSVLENISNAMPQSLQPTGFMQPMDQKKSPEIARFSFADGGQLSSLPKDYFSPEKIIQILRQAETGSFKDPFIFTTKDSKDKKSGLYSSAFGPIQFTYSLLENYRDRGLIPKEAKEYGNKLIEQGRKRINILQGNIPKDESFTGGKKGTISMEEHQKFYPILEKIHVQALLKEANNLEDVFKIHYDRRRNLPSNFINVIKSNLKNKENKTFPKPEFKPKPREGFIDKIQNVLGRT